MKKIFLLLSLTALFFSCEEKKDEVAPELSGQVVGTYAVTELKVDGVKYPLDKADISIILKKFSSEVVSGVMTLKLDGTSEPDENLGTINLKNAGSTGIDLYEGTEKVGNISKENVLSIYVVFEGQDFEMIAKKK
jgi:hypothetical protein